jgi:dUTP pyrophosphatase
MVFGRLHPDAVLPQQKKPGDAGYDLHCLTDIIIPGECVVSIKTGIGVAMQPGQVGLVRDRSSVGAKGIIVCGGVIDSGYRGEIIVVLANLMNDAYRFRGGQAIAQLIILNLVEQSRSEFASDEKWARLSNTERGATGFGST